MPMPLEQTPSHRRAGPWLVLVALLILSVLQLRHQGRIWWCACGQPWLWSGNIWSAHNSQHLFDPYSFTHILHGVLFCGLLGWVLPRLPIAWRFCLAVFFEALWEVVENTELIIGRYRASTASLDYQGDSIANSLGDIVSFAVGFALARRLGLWKSIVFFFLTEGILFVWIKDGLLLNVLMLLYPIDAIRRWQIGT